jgi:hypothetical protein
MRLCGAAWQNTLQRRSGERGGRRRTVPRAGELRNRLLAGQTVYWGIQNLNGVLTLVHRPLQEWQREAWHPGSLAWIGAKPCLG